MIAALSCFTPYFSTFGKRDKGCCSEQSQNNALPEASRSKMIPHGWSQTKSRRILSAPAQASGASAIDCAAVIRTALVWDGNCMSARGRRGFAIGRPGMFTEFAGSFDRDAVLPNRAIVLDEIAMERAGAPRRP